jgi:hypothetical protein
MNRIEKHVEALFAKYRPTQQITELKEEMISNLEAKVQDLIAEGMTEEEAAAVAIRHLHSIDHLIDGNCKVYKYEYFKQLVQFALLYASIAWVVSIPLGLVSRIAMQLTFYLPLLIVLLILTYVIMSRLAEGRSRGSVIYINQYAVRRWRHIAWLLWALFMLTVTLSITAFHFGSNLWFGTPVAISGPYQFGVVTAAYALPWLSILIPLLVRQAEKLLERKSINGGDEDE